MNQMAKALRYESERMRRGPILYAGRPKGSSCMGKTNQGAKNKNKKGRCSKMIGEC